MTTKILLLTLFVPSLLFASDDSFTFKQGGKTLKTLSSAEISNLVKAEEVKVWNPNNQIEIKFRAYDLQRLFDAVYGKSWKSVDEMLITCTDGYQPMIPEERFTKYKAYLAFERTDQKEFTIVEKTESNKKVDVGPFYLIWDNLDHPEIKNSDGTSWPFKLAGVDLTSFQAQFPQIAPPAESSSKVKRGFVSFQRTCLNCHSINGQGGKTGPELNYPVNVTEYYNLKYLKKWILEPTSIRNSAPMPSYEPENPKREEIVDDVISYLKAMVQAKIKPGSI